MHIDAICETNGKGWLIWAAQCPGAFARGATENEALAKLPGNVPIALVNLALGMLCGTLLPEKAVGGMCGALLTNVSAWLSGIWFSLDLGGKVFRRIAYALPFANAVDAARAALAGDWGGMFPQLWIVLAWAFGLLTAAIVIFRRKMTAR